jgi:hypothetical protein
VKNVAPLFPVLDFDPSRYFPVNQYKDTPYLALLGIGLLVSLTSAAGLLYLAWRERGATRYGSRTGDNRSG